MTKAEMIERYGIEYYEQHKARILSRQKERYQNEPEFRKYMNARCKERYNNDTEYYREYTKNDLNSNGKTKHNIRGQSYYILFKQREHTKIKGYQIHHCFGYEDPNKFIYIPKVLHTKIHRFLRDNNIDADSNHYKYIVHMINECTDYTYVSA